MKKDTKYSPSSLGTVVYSTGNEHTRTLFLTLETNEVEWGDDSTYSPGCDLDAHVDLLEIEDEGDEDVR